jgi:hypothetical protein
MGIKVKREAKYLGLSYNANLNINHSIQCLKPKMQYVTYKLYRLLRIANLRTRFNLWQVFIMPLIRMIISAVGKWKSKRCLLIFSKIHPNHPPTYDRRIEERLF